MNALPPTLQKKTPKNSVRRNWIPFFRRNISVKTLTDFTRSFAVMIQAHLPLIQALETTIREQPDPSMKGVLTDMVQKIRQGQGLSDGLAAHPDVFSPLYVQMVRVGESAGALDRMLLRLAHYLEQQDALRRRIRAAMSYPAVILSIALLALTFMLMVVVPTFALMYTSFGADLPAPTRLILYVSQHLKTYGWLWGLGALASFLGLRGYLSQPQGKRLVEQIIVRLPILGQLWREAVTARFCQMLGTLLQGGVHLTDALYILQESLPNSLAGDEVRQMHKRVLQGKGLAQPTRGSRIFPALVVQMMAVGEETARLDEMLLHLSTHYEGEVDDAVQTLTAVLEPLMMVVLGLVVGFILIAMYLPIFKLVDVMGG